ncbi:MAG: hypothetical protein DRH37_07170, partial [Deltaproteobacteria bacterium]
GAAYRMYASASSLDFPGLAQQFAFPDRKLTRAPNFIYGRACPNKSDIFLWLKGIAAGPDRGRR